MLNGRYDQFFPFKPMAQSMFSLLGTPNEHKRLLVDNTDHYVPRNELIRQTLAWLDAYLGPVERAAP